MTATKLHKVDIIFTTLPMEPYTIITDLLKKYTPAQVINEVLESGLRGRGGAGFPTGLKWKFAAAATDPEKYIICNADEGEPGTFKDREILTRVPRKVLSGMALAAYAAKCTKGYIYLRGEYRFLLKPLNEELVIFNGKMKELGVNFEVSVFMGSGAYVCGEETALIESMEGKRGEPRNKPPFPVQHGYLGKPTIVNNVETLASAFMACRLGAAEYKKLGTQDQRGSKLFSISGDTPKAGVHELELGMNIADFVKEFGDGDTKAVQVGGVAGFCIPRKKFESTIIGQGNTTGGSTMIFNSKRSMYRVLHNYLEFFAEESCGQCTPCRVGCQQLLKGIEAVKHGKKPAEYLNQLNSRWNSKD